MPFSFKKPTSSSASSKTKDAQRTASSEKRSSKSGTSKQLSNDSKGSNKAAEKKESKAQGSFLKAFKKMIPCAFKKAMKNNFDDVEVVELTVDPVVSRPRQASVVEQTRSDNITRRRVGGSPPPPSSSTQEMGARAESLQRLIEALEGFETGNRVTVDDQEDLEDSQDVVICYALSPEDEGHVPQGVGAFGSAGTIDTYPSSSTSGDRAGVVAPELFLTPPSPPNRSLLITCHKRKDDYYLSPSPLFASTFIPVDAVVVTEVQVEVQVEEDEEDDSAFDAAYFDLFNDENARNARIAQQALSSAQELADLLGPPPNVGPSHLSDEEEDAAMVAQRALAAAQDFEDLLNGF